MKSLHRVPIVRLPRRLPAGVSHSIARTLSSTLSGSYSMPENFGTFVHSWFSGKKLYRRYELSSMPIRSRFYINFVQLLHKGRMQTLKLHFEELVKAVGTNVPAGFSGLSRDEPKGIAGLLASKCVERYSVPTIVLVPSTTPGIVVGSGRSAPGK
jgi:hypothetical protein